MIYLIKGQKQTHLVNEPDLNIKKEILTRKQEGKTLATVL